jgi:hypothetical protein
MSDDRIVIEVFLVKLNGRRKGGRPKLRWLHCSENYLKSSGYNRWRYKVEYGTAWAIGEAKNTCIILFINRNYRIHRITQRNENITLQDLASNGHYANEDAFRYDCLFVFLAL